jgi:diguanylate cyclase (GGDEF)-like protein
MTISFAPRAWALAPAIELPAQTAELHAFLQHVELLEDPTGELAIEAVSATGNNAAFTAATAKALNVGFTDSAWWIRFRLSNTSPTPQEILLRQNYPLIDQLDLYWKADDAGAWERISTGDRQAFGTRPVWHRDFIFPLNVPPSTERTYYLRFQSQGPVDISLALTSAPEVMASISEEQLAYGIYFGCVLMLLVWSGLVFIAVRDKAFFAYFAYVAAFGLYMLINNGLAFQFLWPNSPRWANTSLLVLLHLAGFASLQFSRVILRSSDYTPRLDRGAQGLQLIFVLSLLLTPLFGYAQIVVPLTGLIMIAVLYMLFLGTVSMISGSRPARFYLLAWGSFLAGSIVFLLKNFGVVPHTFLSQNGWQMGALVEMILLSMSLSSRMNELKHQSRTDSLTLLGNRRLFDDKLPAQFTLARTMHKPLSLLVLDIDHFKMYNDRHGHARGDEAIKVVASALRRHTRKPFIACRYGGEEFTLILPSTEATTAETLAERLRSTVQESLSGDLAITISIGYASLSHASFESAEQLFEAADSAMYAAKQQGRNRVVAFSEKRKETVTAPELMQA